MNIIREEESKKEDISTQKQPAAKFFNKKNQKYIYLILFVFLIPLFAFGWKLYDNIQTSNRQERLDLAVLCEENYNINDYQDFIDKYPHSENCRKVKQRMNELETLAAVWKQISNSHNANVFVDFKNKYNDKYYARLCNLKLDSIDWDNAKAANTPESYQDYINRHPSGNFLYEASEAKLQVAYMNVNTMEAAQLQAIGKQFFNAIEYSDTTVINQLLAVDVEQFLSDLQPTRNDIYECIEQKKKSHKFITFLIHEEAKYQKDISENNERIFTSSFLIDQITTNEKGEEKVDSLRTTLKMNKDYQVFSFSVEQI